MSCNTIYPFTYSVTYPAPCDACQDCGTTGCQGNADAKCVFYTGAALPCSGIATNDNLEVALQKVEEQICSVIGNYATYNTYCLAPVTTQQQFVEKISLAYCNLQSDYDFFINTTFPAYQAQVNVDINGALYPQVTCTLTGVTTADSVATVLTKYCTEFTNIWNYIDISTVTWNGCFTVPTPPTNVAEGFDLLASQICSVAATVSPLPTFNNIGSCLPSPGSADTLAQTIDKIKTRLCQTPTLDLSTITWGCTPDLSTSNTDLNGALQGIVNSTSDWFENKLTFSPDFTVSYVDPLDTCQGKYLELATPIVSTDRLVASNVADLSPGTLIDKLTPGTNITLDDTTTPGQVIINATTADTYQVKASSTDTTPDYLIDKVTGKYNTPIGIGITDSYNAITKTVDFTPTINWAAFVPAMLAAINADPVLYAQLCGLTCGCNCSTTTTTTTSSTTTTTTTLVPVWSIYPVDIYSCVDCGAGSTGSTVAQLPYGTTVSVGMFFQNVIPEGPAGNVYMLTSIVPVAGPATITLEPTSATMSCTASCAILPPP